MDMSLLFGVLLWCTALSAIVMNHDLYSRFDFVIHVALLALASSIPFVFIVGVILHWLLVVKRFHMWVMVRLRPSSAVYYVNKVTQSLSLISTLVYELQHIPIFNLSARHTYYDYCIYNKGRYSSIVAMDMQLYA